MEIKHRPNQTFLACAACLWALGAALVSPVFGASQSRFAAADITQPEFFPILPWDPYHGWGKARFDHRENGFESLLECHFNMAGFVLPEDLRRCRQLGLGAILLPADPAFTNFNYFRQWKTLSDEQINRRVQQWVRASGSNPAIMGYFITDEPGVGEFPALAKAVAAVKKYAPGKLAYINLFPDYATIGAPDHSQLGTSNYRDYLERFVNEVHPQAVSYDNYMVQLSDDLQEPAQAASYYRNLLEIRRVAQAHQLPFLNIVCANQIRPRIPVPSPANLAFQAYTTLAAGYRGVTWYDYYGPGYKYTAIDSSGNRSLTWAYLQGVNAQIKTLAPILCRLNSTGVFFNAPAPVENLPLLPGRLVEAVTGGRVMVGEFKQPQGDDFFMLVNLSLEASARLTVKTRQPQQRIEQISAADGSRTVCDPEKGIWLTAGQGLLLQVGD